MLRRPGWGRFVPALVIAPLLTAASETRSREADRYESFGAVVAPATLPSGASALYGYAGVQDIAVGFRQGLSSFEFEARARVNYFLLTGSLELLLRHTIYRTPSTAVAPFLGVGGVYDTGSRYLRAGNFQYSGVRALGGVVATYRIAETVRAVGEIDVPLDIALNPSQGYRFSPLAGGGTEIYLGSDVSGLIMAQFGVDSIREPLGVAVVSFGYQVKVGLGFRLF